MSADPICTCGHPAVNHMVAGRVGRCTHVDGSYAGEQRSECRCRRFAEDLDEIDPEQEQELAYDW